MKTLNTILILVAMWMLPVSAQTNDDFPCSSHQHLLEQIKKNPALIKQMQDYEENIMKGSSEDKRIMSGSNVITIPLVFHVVYKVDSQNVSDARILHQIEMLNRDFAGLNPHTMGAFSNSLKANTYFQFCLAAKKPNGEPSTGIERRQTTVDSFTNDYVKYYNYGGLDIWDPTRYFNIWICNAYRSWGQFPGTGVNKTYGAVVQFKYFGKTGAHPRYNNGAITSHEVGHCFNLRHTWGDDNGLCTGTDFCDDVPNHAGPTFGRYYYTGVLTDSCTTDSPGIMYQNFMDYSNDSMKACFTPDQTARMQANFASSSSPLYSLISSDACVPATSCEVPNGLSAVTSNNKAALSWRAMYNATKYNVRYKAVSSSSWITTTTTKTTLSVSNLSKNTPYEFQVQNICSGGSSNYSASKTFATVSNRSLDINNAENSSDLQFTLFPNPANTEITVTCLLPIPGVVNTEIRDLSGKLLISESELNYGTTFKHTFNLAFLNPGIYLVSCQLPGGQKFVNKMIKE